MAPPLIGAALVATASALEATALAGTLAAPVAIGSLSLGTVGSLVGSALLTAGSVGAQFAFNRLSSQRGKKGDPQLTAITIKQAIPVRTRAYGQVKLSGPLFYEDAIPAQYQPLIFGIVHCEGPIEQYVQYFLNDAATGVSGTPNTEVAGVNLALPWGTLITLEGMIGKDSQVVNSILHDYRSFTGTLNGLAYSVALLNQPPGRPDKYFQYFYPNGIPTVKAIIKASKVYDPRDGSQVWNTPSTWKFSRNPALHAMDFLTYFRLDVNGNEVPRGMGLPRSRINTASFAAFANICDETMHSAYSINPADGSVSNTPRDEPRYQCDGAYQMDEAPTDVLRRILATCDGTLYTLPDGTVGIRGGKWEEPTVLINDDMIINCDLTHGNGKFESFNRLKIAISATNMDYQLVDGAPYDDVEDIDANGVLQQDLSLPFVQSYSQARRIAKIEMAKGNPEWTYNSLTCTLAALNAIGEQVVHVTHSLPGIDGPFLIRNVKLQFDTATVELQLSSLDGSAYEWNAATDDRPPPSPQGGTG
jgi:hypothetical protein